MPTGYTEGILNGKINSFEEFTKTCMRAFGATIHMREDDIKAEYVPREVDSYYRESLDKWTMKLNEINSLTDEEILEKKESELNSQIEYYREKIKNVEECNVKLNDLRNKVSIWTPPTDEHTNLKKFMLDQLDLTIESDGNTSYYTECLNNAYNESFKLDAKKIREEYMKDIMYSIESSKKNLNKEIERVNQSNKWVEQLLNSL